MIVQVVDTFPEALVTLHVLMSGWKLKWFRESTLLKNVICFLLAVLGLCCREGLSLAVAPEGDTPLVARGQLTAVPSLIVERSLKGARTSVVAAPGLQSAGSVAVAHKLSCSRACGIFPDYDRTHVSGIGRWILNTKPPGNPWVNFKVNKQDSKQRDS